MEKSGYTKQEIADKVTEILRENYFDTPPVDIYKLLDNYGVIVHRKHFPLKFANVSGFITFADDEKTTPIFVLNREDSEDRQKYALAHEFGHWMLHKQKLLNDPALSILYKSPIGSKTTDQVEIEANDFAAQLLVPDAMLHTEHEETSTHKPDRKALAEKFGVGEDIIGFRLDQQESDDENSQPTGKA